MYAKYGNKVLKGQCTHCNALSLSFKAITTCCVNDEKIMQHEIWTMVDVTVMWKENVLFSISMEHFKARGRPSVYVYFTN